MKDESGPVDTIRAACCQRGRGVQQMRQQQGVHLSMAGRAVGLCRAFISLKHISCGTNSVTANIVSNLPNKCSNLPNLIQNKNNTITCSCS